MSDPRRALRLALALLFAGLAVLLSPAAPAQAHTELVRSSPPDGAALRELPPAVTLLFSEPVTASDLTAVAGQRMLPVRQLRARVLRVDLRSLGNATDVQLVWRLVSSHDGHESTGSIRLYVGTPPASAAPVGPTEEPRAIGLLEVWSRILGYLSLTVFVGGLFFLSVLWPAGADERRTRILLGAAVAGGAIAAADTLAVAQWRAAPGVSLAATLADDFGRAHSVLLLLWLLAAVVVVAAAQRGEVVVRSLPWRVGAIAVALGLVRTTGMTAHASQTRHPTWGVVADFLHVTAVSAWVGGLLVLALCLLPRRQLSELERVVPGFSKVALASVLVIVTSGLILLWQIAGSVDGFWSTHYARVLLVKLAFFALVLTAAFQSKRWVETHLLTGTETGHRFAPRTTTRAFALSVGAESVLVLTVLTAVGVLVTTSPGM